MPKQPHVVWVCQWYPHEGEPYAGDFIQRHAKAASLFLPITTFSCFAHISDKIESCTSDNLTEHVIYFKTFKTGINRIDKLIYWSKWYRLLKQHLLQHFNKNGKPGLLHCHIILNAGWLGLWAKKKFGIPYLVTEHWSGYMPGAFNGFDAYNPWSKRLFSKILNWATIVTGVSYALIEVLQKLHPQAKYVRLPNVVDETVFTPSITRSSNDIFRIIHISTFSAHKNMEDTFKAFDALAENNAAVEFHIVGPQERIARKWPDKKFSTAYIFHREMPQPELAALMKTCDVCVLYSHYETFGCVIIEANAVELPVVVSDIPVLQEIVQSGVNGILVTPSNPEALAEVLFAFINRHHKFDSLTLSKSTSEKFAYKVVGKQILELYNSILTTNN